MFKPRNSAEAVGVALGILFLVCVTSIAVLTFGAIAVALIRFTLGI